MSDIFTKTCKDCIHFDRCSWLLSLTGEEVACDWIPSKFQARPLNPEETQQAIHDYIESGDEEKFNKAMARGLMFAPRQMVTGTFTIPGVKR